MTDILTDNVVIADATDEVQLVVKGASAQTLPLQEWQDNSGTVLSQIDKDGHLLVGDEDGTIDALIESHNIEDSAKPSRGLHTKGVLTGALTSLVSWAVEELGLKGTGGISALHRALRVQATNENTGDMDAGANIRAGDFEVINTGGNVSVNNLELSALVAKVNNQSGAYADKAYGLKIEIDDAGSSNDVYAIHTDNGIIHFGDLLELVAGVVLEDSATDGVLGITPRSVAPTTPNSGMMYLDDGTNRADGLSGFRRWNGSGWDDIVDTSSIGDGNVSGPGSSIDNAIARFDSTTGKLLQNSGAILDDNGKITSNALKVNDSATTPPLNITERSTAPTTPASGDIYLDDGTNTASGDPGWRHYTGSAWEDISGGNSGSNAVSQVISTVTTIDAGTQVLTHQQAIQSDYTIDGRLVTEFLRFQDNAGHPSIPATNKLAIYANSGELHTKDDAGVQTAYGLQQIFFLVGVAEQHNYSNGTWNTVRLNSENYDKGSDVSLASYQWTPTSGNWIIVAYVYTYDQADEKGLRIYNATTAQVDGVNEGVQGYNKANSSMIKTLTTQLTANGTDAFELQVYYSLTRKNANSITSTFATLMAWRI